MFVTDFGNVLQIGILALGIAVVSYLQFRYRFLQYIFFLRVPLLHALVLVLLPLAVFTRAFGNLFVLDPLQLTAVAFLLVLSTWTVTYATGLVFVGAAPRFTLRFRQPDSRQVRRWDVAPPGNRTASLIETHRRRAYVLPLVLGFPILAVAFMYSPGEWWRKVLAITAGLVLAFAARELAVWTGYWCNRWLYRPQDSQPSYSPLRLRTRLRLLVYRFSDTLIGRALTWPFSRGYSNLVSDGTPASRTPAQETVAPFTHWHAVGFTGLALTVYALGGLFLDPGGSMSLAQNIPALAYLLLVLILLGLLLPLTTFFLDYYRVPLIVMVMVLLFLSYWSSDLDHYYDFSTEAYAAGAPLPRPLTAEEAISGWTTRHEPGTHPVMVVVAISGGGSHAARWTTEVLTRLRADDRVGRRFFEATSFVSAVSGGALGAMYALEGYQDGTVPSGETLADAKEAASRSNVGALAWGLTYPDLVRKIVPSLFDRRHDRAWALEQSWRAGLADPSRMPTLMSWSEEARRGVRPAVVFNATLMESGKRFLLSGMQIPDTTAQEFTKLYAERDLSVVTATRLSAAFPYLSPMARPLSPYEPGGDADKAFDGSAFHVADGGYYDSTGVLTVVEFLKAVVPVYKASGRSKILLVQILTSPDPEPAAGNKGWLSGLAGPPSTALAVSQSSQADRAALEIRLLIDRWSNGDLPESKQVQITPITFRYRGTGTLPWHLSEAEKQEISRAWMEQKNQNELSAMVSVFAESP